MPLALHFLLQRNTAMHSHYETTIKNLNYFLHTAAELKWDWWRRSTAMVRCLSHIPSLGFSEGIIAIGTFFPVMKAQMTSNGRIFKLTLLSWRLLSRFPWISCNVFCGGGSGGSTFSCLGAGEPPTGGTFEPRRATHEFRGSYRFSPSWFQFSDGPGRAGRYVCLSVLW